MESELNALRDSLRPPVAAPSYRSEGGPTPHRPARSAVFVALGAVAVAALVVVLSQTRHGASSRAADDDDPLFQPL
jgi:hypothetical protein